MTSAVARFFETEKLVAKVGTFLNNKDLLSYMRTCRSFHTNSTPLLYHSLKLGNFNNYKRLAHSSEALEAWTRNTDFIQSISLVQNVLDQYYPKELAVVAAVAAVTTIDRILHDLAFSPSDTPATTIDSTTPDYGEQTQNDDTTTTTTLAPATISMVTPQVARMTLQPAILIPGLLLPPLTNLTHFHYRYSTSEHASFTNLDKNADCQAVQLVGLLKQSPHLRVIHLHDILVRAKMALEKFTRTISGYTKLETLALDLWVPDSWSDRVLAAIFFSCPQSIKVLRIDFQNYLGESKRFDIAARTLEAPLLRQEPTLHNLIEFCLSGPYLLVLEDLLVMLEYIPEVITLGLPRIRKPIDADSFDRDAADAVGRVAVEKCPKVRNLAQCSGTLDNSLSLLVPFVEALPKTSLKSLAAILFCESEDPFLPALHRHVGSLTSIDFDKCEVSSRTIHRILRGCPFLEKFEAAHIYNCKSFLTLEDATAQPWASTKLTSLGLVIELGDMDIPDVDWHDLTLEQKTSLGQLDVFYRQIGALTSLKHLALQVLVNPENESDGSDHGKGALAHSKRCFPRLLKLGGGMEGKNRGWLDCLSGLNKLEHLHGSFNVAIGYDECMVGQAEAEWMAQHWPRLRSADFLREDDALVLMSGVPPCLVWLKEQLSGLRIFV
ncbi:hypothetical protein BGZ47_004520 [Haplosporangium gracile]|nr:hypothetical protein BGZ47_004520 [Haplosporangium gracile]